MSSMSKQIVSCPKCGMPIEYTMWHSINDMEPSNLENVMSGKLFEAKCKNCGQKVRMNYPILVNDMEHNVEIFFCFPEETKQTEKIIESQRKWYTGKMRIVTDQDSLMEKVAIFHAGLDDRVIELLKVDYMNRVQDQLSDKKVHGVYFLAEDNPRFEIVYDHGSGYISIDMEDYKFLEDYYFGEEDRSIHEKGIMRCTLIRIGCTRS